jgi:hypothetical protein
MKRPTILSLICLTAALVFNDCQAQDIPLDAVAKLMDRYCVDCHDGAESAAELNLTNFDTSIAVSSKSWDTSTWEKIVKRLSARQMPPADAERPSEAEYRAVLVAMKSALDRTAEQFPQPGRTDSVRRLNRTEYHNAVRDLLAVDVDVDSLLPADQLSHGFDNVTVGELSPLLLGRYITAAEKISRQAVGGLGKSPGGITVRLPADRTQDAHVESLPLGTRGGTLFKQHFPANGQYEVQLRLMRDRDENIEGLTGTHEIDVLLDRGLVHRFTVVKPNGKVGYDKDDTLVDAHLKKRFQATAGPHKVGVTFPSKFSSLLEINRQPFEASFNKHRHPRRAPALFEVSIVGPFDPEGSGDTPSRRKIFAAAGNVEARRELNPTERATQILRPLVRLAYRRPVTDKDLIVPLRFFKQRFEADGFETGIETALSAVLVNPHFLLRAEKDPEGLQARSAYQLSDIELASRLSFFLWSSIPDEELLTAAERGQLSDPAVLNSQVQRMLRDERSQSLVSNFAAQWLYLRNLDSFQPDRRLFPNFDDNLRHALRRETELLFESVLKNDRSVLDLLNTDTTFLNERLAKHYEIPHVFGSHFRPVVLTNGSHRGGLLRHGSILAVTSYATRTSPTIRGNWVLENILGTPAPPPPPNVPSLKDKTAASAITIRERLDEHRENPACASCHNLMDPVGFSLENFDAVGRWRLFDQEQPVDSSGALPDGTSVNSLEELEAGILGRPKLFVSTLTGKLLTFALGRGVESFDAPAIRKVVREAANKDYRFSSLIHAIVTSTPFQMRVTQ